MMDKINNLSGKQKIGVLSVFILLMLLGIVLTAVPKKQEIRPRAAGSGEVDLRFEPASGTTLKGSTLQVGIKLYKTASRTINASGAQAVINVDSKFTINSATCEAPFNGLPVANISGQTVTFICGIALGTNPVALDATGKSFASVKVTIKNDAADGAAPVTFSSTRVTEAGQVGQAPDVSTGGQSASFTVGSGTITGVPKNKVSWDTGYVTLEADDFYIIADGKKYLGKPDPNTTLNIGSDPGSATYTTLEAIWQEQGVEMRLFMYFNADTNTWWSGELRTYNGKKPGDWLYYKGKFFETKLGTASTGNFDLANDPNDNFKGGIHFENLKLQAFTKRPVACLTFPTTDTFEGAGINSDLWEVVGVGIRGNIVNQNNGVLHAETDGIASADRAGLNTNKKICGDFDVRVDFSKFTADAKRTGVANLWVVWGGEINSYIYIEMFKDNINQGFRTDYNLNGVWQKPNTWKPTSGTSGKLRIKRRASIVTTYYDDNSGSGWQELSTFTNAPGDDANVVFGVGSWDPDRPGSSANFDNFMLTGVIPDPTFTPVPSATPTPSISPTPTPPSGEDKYTIDVGDKQFLTFNIAPGATPQIRFKAQLSNLANKPQMFLKLRVKDELAFIKNPSAGSSGDSCNNPPVGSKDFNIPSQADGDVYKPVQDINGPPPGGGKAATVSVDGWVSLDGVIPGRYYTLLLKGPKTRSVKVAEHVLLQPNQNTEIQDFDWTSKPIDPGDLPDPNNSMKQDCTVNSVDLSLITSRLGATDGDSLNIGDVNYDGIINGNDVSKVVNTLSTKPDDDL